MIEAPQERPSEWRGGWTLALAACAGMTLSALPGVTMGLFIGPLEQQFKWSRATISSGLVAIAIMGAVLAPFIGMVIDRVGPRRIGIAGALLMCMAFSWLALTNGSLLLWYGLWFVIALAMVMLSPTVWTAAVASRFEASRGGAIAIALAGSVITGIFAPQMTGYMLSNHGWRTAYVGTAMIWGVVVLPLLFLFSSVLVTSAG